MDARYQRVYIIGAGAIGKTLAVCLQKAGKEVILIRGRAEAYGRSLQTIRVRFPDGRSLESDIETATITDIGSFDGIIAITAKSYGNADLAFRLKGRTGDSPIVIMQNGLGVEQPFVDADFDSIYRCVLFVTSQTVDERTLQFKPVSECPIGPVKGPSNEADMIAGCLDSPDFRFRPEVHIQPVIWQKAIINCVFNSVCPLLDTDNGIFHRQEAAFQLARKMIAECVSIARGCSIFLEEGAVEEKLLQISRSSDGQLISTLQDIRGGRQTEIDTLNFAIVAIARELGLAQTVEITEAFGVLTKLRSVIGSSVVA